jgi:uncharacterized small protein (DUF1192 family)
MTLDLLKTVSLPVATLETEGNKLLVAVHNLELVHKAVSAMEEQVDNLEEEINILKTELQRKSASTQDQSEDQQESAAE